MLAPSVTGSLSKRFRLCQLWYCSLLLLASLIYNIVVFFAVLRLVLDDGARSSIIEGVLVSPRTFPTISAGIAAGFWRVCFARARSCGLARVLCVLV